MNERNDTTGDAQFEEHIQLSASEYAQLREAADAHTRTLAGQTGTPAVAPPALVDTHVMILGYDDFLCESAIKHAQTLIQSGDSVLVISFGANSGMIHGRNGIHTKRLKAIAAKPGCTGSFDIHNGTCDILGLTAGNCVNTTSNNAQPHQQARWWNDDAAACDFLVEFASRYRNILSVTQAGVRVEADSNASDRINYVTHAFELLTVPVEDTKILETPEPTSSPISEPPF